DFLGRFTPEDVERIATRLYSELLSHGYTAVGEFHYLHNDINGNHYSNPAEMSDAIVRAAKATGIHLTLLPVMYETADFGGKPAHDGQKRFTHTADAFVRLMELLVKQYGTDIEVTLGIAPHSLRAVTPDSLQRLLDALPALGLSGCPVHIHAAEQMKEVNDCVAWVGVRPVEFLLKTYAVNGQWCLIHATHMTEAETINLARTGAVAGLCPTTEGNLGDGIFPAPDYLAAGGHVGIGSDSNMCVSPFEELRLMEYNQRLHLQKRAVLCLENTPSVGRTLYQKAAQGGAQALGIKAGVIAKGYRADMIAPAMEHFLLEDKHGDAILDTLVFAVNPRITDSFVAGRHIKQRNM
ncbi:MAG: formimidoylglutamate deiminase, partial [Alphaproteobacteria bacterium]